MQFTASRAGTGGDCLSAGSICLYVVCVDVRVHMCASNVSSAALLRLRNLTPLVFVDLSHDDTSLLSLTYSDPVCDVYTNVYLSIKYTITHQHFAEGL